MILKKCFIQQPCDIVITKSSKTKMAQGFRLPPMSRAAALRADVERLRLEVSSARAALNHAVDILERVEGELDELAVEAEIELENPVSASPSVHIDQQFVYTTCPPPVGGSVAAPEAAQEPAATASGLPSPGPKSRFWYAVAKSGPAGAHRGWGIYRDYQGFCDAVRDHSVAWSGRGRFPWADGATGQKFGSEREAHEFIIAELKLASDANIPHHPFE